MRFHLWQTLSFLLFISCASSGPTVRNIPEMDEDFFKSSSSNRKAQNAQFEIEVETPRRLHITNAHSGEERFMDLDWPIFGLRLCPMCPYANLTYTAQDGIQYNTLLNIQLGEIIFNLGPSDYHWSEAGDLMAMGYAQKIEVLRTDDFEQFLAAKNYGDKQSLMFRRLSVKPDTGKNIELLAFYESSAIFFQLGCCENPETFAFDLESNRVYRILCASKECNDIDDLEEKFIQARNRKDAHQTLPQFVYY